MPLRIPVEVWVPDGATHYFGDLLDMPTFYKRRDIGVAGEHWFFWSRTRKTWVMSGHHQPHWTLPIPEEYRA